MVRQPQRLHLIKIARIPKWLLNFSEDSTTQDFGNKTSSRLAWKCHTSFIIQTHQDIQDISLNQHRKWPTLKLVSYPEHPLFFLQHPLHCSVLDFPPWTPVGLHISPDFSSHVWLNCRTLLKELAPPGHSSHRFGGSRGCWSIGVASSHALESFFREFPGSWPVRSSGFRPR